MIPKHFKVTMCIMFVPCGAAADQDGGKEINLSPSDLLQTHKYYSVLKLLTGLATATLIAWKLVVTNAITTTKAPAILAHLR